MDKKHYDAIVIGGGPGGYPAAIKLSQSGLKTALITKSDDLGGTCLNRGCIPSKSLIHSAKILNDFEEAEKYGIKIGKVEADYQKMVMRKDEVVEKMRQNLGRLLKSNGVDVITGTGSFNSPSEIKVSGDNPQVLTFTSAIIATGSEPKNISAFPFDGKKILDSTSILNITELPSSIVIIGAGYIGCEFASLFNYFGVKVTMLEMMPSILPNECPSMSSALAKNFESRGIIMKTNALVEGVDTSKKDVFVQVTKEEPLQTDLVLVAIGRKLNTDGIGLEKAGVAISEHSTVKVDEHMETTQKGIFAIGDIASSYQLAHVATHQGIVAARNIAGHPAKMDYHAVPSVIFTDPEIATVGLSLEAAIKEGRNATLSSFPFQALGKAQADLQTDGFSQVVVDCKTGQILGAQVIGHGASNLIAEMALAIANELTIECISETIHAHPTIAEVWMEAAFVAQDKPLHMPPRKKKEPVAT